MKYEKQDAPAWQRKLVVVLGALGGATLLLFMVWALILLLDSSRVNECLESGGRYDYESEECVPEAR